MCLFLQQIMLTIKMIMNNDPSTYQFVCVLLCANNTTDDLPLPLFASWMKATSTFAFDLSIFAEIT